MSALSAIQRLRVNELPDVVLDMPAQKRAGYLARMGGCPYVVVNDFVCDGGQ